MAAAVLLAWQTRPLPDDRRTAATASALPEPSQAPPLAEIGLGRRDVAGRGLSSSGSVLLVFAGGCGGCSPDALDPRSASVEGHDQVWFVYTDPAAGRAVAQATGLPRNVRIVVAPEALMRRSLAPLWPGKSVRYRDGLPIGP
jgi:hypothetical protein